LIIVHQPHAKLFETVFSDPVEAVSFFQAHAGCPDSLDGIMWYYGDI
jgi:hypothetical protein